MAERNEELEGIEKKLKELEGNTPSFTMDSNPPELEDIRTKIHTLRSRGIAIPETTNRLFERIESEYTQAYYLMISTVAALA